MFFQNVFSPTKMKPKRSLRSILKKMCSHYQVIHCKFALPPPLVSCIYYHNLEMDFDTLQSFNGYIEILELVSGTYPFIIIKKNDRFH